MMDAYKENLITVSDRADMTKVLNDIVATNPDNPFYVCDLNDIVNKHKLWRKLIPNIQPYYAVRCNNSKVVLETLAALEMGFSCVSKSELQQLLSIGVDPSRIIFNNTTKYSNHIQCAMESSIKLMTFDGESELRKIYNISPEAEVLLQIHGANSKARSGCDPYTEASTLLKIADGLKMNVVGLAFEIDLKLADSSEINNILTAAFYVLGIADAMGFKFKILFINGEHPNSLDEQVYTFSKCINSIVDKNLPSKGFKVVLESGSYFVRSAFKYACNVFGIKERQFTDANTKETMTHYSYLINDGAFGNFGSVFFWEEELCPELLFKREENKYASALWGPTNDPADVLCKNILLPKLNYGDWLIFNNMGSYTLVITTNFNGFGISSTYYLINKQNWFELRDKFALQEQFSHLIE